MTRIPVIGTGAFCCAGNSVDTAFEAIASGRDCLTPLADLETGALKKIPLCGRASIAGIYADSGMPQDATTVFGILAAREAMKNVPRNHGLKCGLVLATTVAGMTLSEIFYRELRKNPAHARLAAAFLHRHEPTATAGTVAKDIGACGFHTVSTACSSGLHAVGMAMRLVNNGVYDMCLATGCDALSILTIRGFISLMLIDFEGCRPFDRRRVGISLGEGAGAVLLASKQAAAKLNQKPLAWASGWGASSDCHHMTAPHPEGLGARIAVQTALLEAGISPDQIDLIAAHGTATPDNDISEIRAMRSVFKELPPFCSMKRTIGHTLAASGTIEAAFCVKAICEGVIPKTAGFEQQDDSINAVPSEGGRKALRHVLKNSFGFGGNNASMVFSASGE
jgi:3-oxoacyl-[acyl-carrier-protein] synthase-1